MYRKRYSGYSRMNICFSKVQPFIYTVKLNYSYRALYRVPKRGFRIIPAKSLTTPSLQMPFSPLPRQYSTFVPQNSFLMTPDSGLKMELQRLPSPSSMNDPLLGSGSSLRKYRLLKVSPSLRRSMMMMLISDRSFSSPQVSFSPTESTRFCSTSVGSRYFLEVSAMRVKKCFNLASSSYSPFTRFNLVRFSARRAAISGSGSAVWRICWKWRMRKQHWRRELRQQQLLTLSSPTGCPASRASQRCPTAPTFPDREYSTSHSPPRNCPIPTRNELPAWPAPAEPTAALPGCLATGGGGGWVDERGSASASSMSTFLRRAYSWARATCCSEQPISMQNWRVRASRAPIIGRVLQYLQIHLNLKPSHPTVPSHPPTHPISSLLPRDRTSPRSPALTRGAMRLRHRLIQLRDNYSGVIAICGVMQELHTLKVVDGHYSIKDRKLGEGSFAKTYLAVEAKTGQVLACKMIEKKNLIDKINLSKNKSLTKEYFINALKNEVKTWKAIHHNHIVEFRDFSETANNIYFFLEFCSGGNLEQHLTTHGAIAQHAALPLFLQLARGCAYLESKNIYHRDIKTENILINAEGILKLSDFGFAKMVSDEETKYNPAAQTSVGTPIYMSPQIIMGDPYTIKCDVWSLGVVFYKMIYNLYPWQKTDNIMVLVERMKKPFDFPPNVEVADWVKQLLRGMLTIDEGKRSSIKDVLEVLQRESKAMDIE